MEYALFQSVGCLVVSWRHWHEAFSKSGTFAQHLHCPLCEFIELEFMKYIT